MLQSYPIPPFVYHGQRRELGYSPVCIQYVPVAYSKSLSAITEKETEITLVLHPPHGSYAGVKQILPLPITIPLAVGQPNIFYLANSDSIKNDRGKYRVEFYYKGNSIPFDVQEWVVPTPGMDITTELTRGSGLIDQLPEGILGEILSIQAPSGSEYALKLNLVEWLSNPPAEGETYSAVVRKFFTLEDLVHETISRRVRGQ